MLFVFAYGDNIDCEMTHLPMEERCNGEIPSGVRGHYQAEEGPDSVVSKWRNEDRGGTASSKYVSPCPLVQIVIYVIYIAAFIETPKILQ